MKRSWDKRWVQLALDQKLPMQARLYRLICLTIGVVCLLVILPVNVFQNLPIGVNLADMLLGLLGLFCFWRSRRGCDYPLVLFFTILLLLNPVWFMNGGCQGSISYYFLVLIIYPTVIVRGTKRWFLAAICVADLCALIVLEYLHPSLTTPFQSNFDQLIDLTSGAFCCGIAICLMMWIVIVNYELEQTVISRYSKDLAESLERVQITQKTMDEASEQVLWVGQQGRIIYSNKAVIEMLGYSSVELASMTIHQLMPEIPASEWAKDWSRLKHEHSIIKEWSEQRRDGSVLPVEAKMTYMNFGGNEYAVAFIRDITERRQAEERRLEMERQMQHVQRLESVGVLAGGIAHDFNNMLMGILGNISLAKADTATDSEMHELLTEAEDAALSAQNLTGQLLTFAKGGKPIKSIISVESVIRNSSSLVLRGSIVTCTIKIGPNLAPINADASQLRQVLSNLIINARDAMPLGGNISITAVNRMIESNHGSAFPPGPYVEITVEDTGVGIDPEKLPRIFDPFFTTKKTGSGLGLAVVHAIIQNHQGQISVESQPGVGAAFKVLLPAVLEPAPVVTYVPTEGPIQLANGHRKYRVLVMDDQEMVRKPLAKLLTKQGFQVECAENGEEAILLFRQAMGRSEPFDLVLLDLTIPGGMGGKQTIQQLRQIDPTTKAVVSSGYSEDPVMSDCQAYGFVDVIVKPYTTVNLNKVLGRVLGQGKP